MVDVAMLGCVCVYLVRASVCPGRTHADYYNAPPPFLKFIYELFIRSFTSAACFLSYRHFVVLPLSASDSIFLACVGSSAPFLHSLFGYHLNLFGLLLNRQDDIIYASGIQTNQILLFKRQGDLKLHIPVCSDSCSTDRTA